ncbi:MAG: hypothetical protein P0Y49_05165 [Candidatus Pedobacter colombiensis]|uniref:Uncharacterized protein n=1 Tax=Candidatus Pedobacter colombiensis TaxID=3121371 RepID=A0AAJ5W9L9_9SPHI|nr:hypothetical protein [Pedobacter sp.]WEK20526.1 MAG: hypothetical protein P0Y49_05165 [Pedobacter sp.]
MEATELHSQDFEIEVNLNGKPTTIQVKTEETTDGAEYFTCMHSGKSLTEIRKEKDGSWEQIWGDLDQQTVNMIGSAISSK